MIDLMKNGSNGQSDHIPCPMCSELSVVKGIISEYAFYDGEPFLLTLSTLLSELKMWRAKDTYEKNLKLVAKSAIIKKLEDDGYEVEG